MPQPTPKEQIFKIYQQLFQYKDMLKNAPPMNFDIATLSEEQRDAQESNIRSELDAVIAYLLGMKPENLSVIPMIEALNQHYKQDDFWRLTLLDYIDVCQQEAEEKLEARKQAAIEEGNALYKRIMEYQRQRKEIIKSFANKLATQHFPINGERLFRNYLNMADIDANQAWEVLITNPAAFSPIIVEDEKGNRVISINDAKQINKKIGSYIKSMKA